MLSVPHLDREFDYLVSADQSDDAQPGVRVRVRFHGRLVDAFLLERRSDTDHVGQLGWLDRVISPEPVLTPEVRRLVDAVVARYAGTRPDVLRLAIPPRHAGAEETGARAPLLPVMQPVDSAGWARYGRGEQFLEALGAGRAARGVAGAAGERWCDRLAEAAAAAVAGGQGCWPWFRTSATSTRCGRRLPPWSTSPPWWRWPPASGRPSATGAGWRCYAARRGW